MLAKVLSSAVLGIDAYIVDVEVDIAFGLPSFATVGLPDVAVKESRDRVKAAIKKEGVAFDLPIAVGILAAMEVVRPEGLRRHAILGELSLDGGIRPVRGVLPMAVQVNAG